MLVMRIKFLIVALLLAGCTQPLAPVAPAHAAVAAQPPAPAQVVQPVIIAQPPAAVVEDVSKTSWTYGTFEDKMRGTSMRIASVGSVNQVDFASPYEGGSKLYFGLRNRPEKGDDVMLGISKGQFICHGNCRVHFKFDNGQVIALPAAHPSDGASDSIMLKGYAFAEKLKASKRLTIEAEFFREGLRQFEFDVAGLDWK